MRQKPYEIVILKPTAVFLSLLASQLPDIKLPDLRLLQIDSTAYAIKKHNSDDATIAEIEKHYPAMFRHEICRWFGDSVRSDLKTKFLDFLCCFKFELHNHIILMEQTLDVGHQLLLLKPRVALLNWLKDAAEGNEELGEVMERVVLANLEENSTVMVKNFTNLTEIKPFIKNYFQPVFKTAMTRFTHQSEQWPLIESYADFSKYFAIEIHTQLVHLHH